MDKPSLQSFMTKTPTVGATGSQKPPLSSFIGGGSKKPIVSPYTGDIRADTPEAAQARKNTAFIGGKNFIKDDIAGAFSGGIDKIKEGYKEGVDSSKDTSFFRGAGKLLEGGVKMGAGFFESLFSPIAPVFHPIGEGTKSVSDKISDIPAVQKFAGSKAGEVVSKGAEVAGNLATIAGGVAGADEIITAAKPKVSDMFSKAKTAVETKLTPKTDTAIIQEKIMPKPTVKEARIAESQGRLVKGKEETLFRSSKPDTVLPSKKTISSAETINRNVPGAAKMNEQELYTALGKKTTEIATDLKPKMEEVPVNRATVKKINSDWDEVKANQIKNADKTEEPNVIKEQEQFEERLQKTKTQSMNDLWDARKAYDDSIPDNVKQANNQSSESLQNKKARWLENRDILNNAINDTKNGLGSESQQAFSDMTDMYSAKTDLLTKAKIETKINPSKIKQAFDSPTGKIIKTVLGVDLGWEAIKKIFGIGK